MRTLTRFAFLFVCLVAIEVRSDPLDDKIEAQLRNQNVPGCSLAVVRDGKIEKVKGYGLADVELNVPATEHSVYQLASITKQFTAAAILVLVHEGKLSLDDPVSRHYPNAPQAWNPVTVRHLLTHTSGIRSYTNLPGFQQNVRKDYQPHELIGLIADLPLDFAPGEKWDYSNTGYYLLGLVIEKVSGQSYAEFLAERILRPAGMETARLNDQFDIIPHRATGYDYRNNLLRRAEFVSPTQPYSAGALVGTVLDLAKWDAALYSDKILPAEMRESMWSSVKLTGDQTADYGYGWQVGELRGRRYVAHGGGINGFSTFFLRLVQDKLTVIVLANGPGDPQRLARLVASQFVPGLTLASIVPQCDSDPALSERLKQCLIELSEKKDSELLTPEFRENFRNSRRRYGVLQEDIKNMKSFTFVVSEEPSATQNKRLGTRIARLCSYKLRKPWNKVVDFSQRMQSRR
ncbi:MAG: serine hydrolase domain-containing protein [Verrucomicrobiales bacterium]